MREKDKIEDYLTDYAKTNTRNLLNVLGCKTPYAYGNAVNGLKKKYNLERLPSGQSINNFLNKSKVSMNTLLDLVALYNKVFNASETLESFSQGTLSLQFKREFTDQYTGFYTCYFLNDSYMENPIIKHGYLNISIENGRYVVRALLRLEKHIPEDYESIKAYLSNPECSFLNLRKEAANWCADNNYYGLFFGEMEKNEDFYLMRLKRPEDIDIKVGFNEMQIYIRRIPEEMRPVSYGSIGILLHKGNDLNLLTQRIVLSKKDIPSNHERIQDLLLDWEDISVYDKDDFKWHQFVKSYEE